MAQVQQPQPMNQQPVQRPAQQPVAGAAQPQIVPPQNVSVFKKWWFWLIILIIIGGAIGVGFWLGWF